MATGRWYRSMRYMHGKYKRATERVLDALFPKGGRRKTCKEIKKRVKQLKSKSTPMDATFPSNIRTAIVWRQRTGQRWSQLETDVESSQQSDNESHAHFIQLLIYIDKELCPPSEQENSEPKSISNIFEQLSIEDVEEELAAETLEQLQEAYATATEPVIDDPNKTLLETDHLTTAIAFLESLSSLIDEAHRICQEAHAGRLDFTTTALMLSIIYGEIKSMASSTALLIDKWEEVDTWVNKEKWKEFGLERCYELLKLTVVMSPLLLSLLGMTPSNRTLSDSPNNLWTIINNSSGNKQKLDTDNPNQLILSDEPASVPATQLLKAYTGDNEMSADDLERACKDVADPLHKHLLSVMTLSEALRCLAQRRNDHGGRGLVTKLVENPVLADIYDHLTQAKPVAAITVMLGIRLFDLLVQESGPTRVHWHGLGSVLRSRYNEDLATMTECTRLCTDPNGIIMGILVAVPPLGLDDYATLFPFTDAWTCGLCYAQVAAACTEVNTAQLWLPAEKNRFVIGLIYIHEYLKLAGATPTAKAFDAAVDYLRRLHGGLSQSSDVNDFLATYKSRHTGKVYSTKYRAERFRSRLQDPNTSLLKLLTEDHYHMQSQWLKLLRTSEEPAEGLLANLRTVQEAITSQIEMSFIPFKLYQSALVACSLLPAQYTPFRHSKFPATGLRSPPSPEEATRLLNVVSAAFMSSITNAHGYGVLAAPKFFHIKVDLQDPLFQFHNEVKKWNAKKQNYIENAAVEQDFFDASKAILEGETVAGELANTWLQEFDDLLEKLNSRLDIKLHRPPYDFPSLSCNLVDPDPSTSDIAGEAVYTGTFEFAIFTV